MAKRSAPNWPDIGPNTQKDENTKARKKIYDPSRMSRRQRRSPLHQRRTANYVQPNFEQQHNSTVAP